jgi:hypothetical protein
LNEKENLKNQIKQEEIENNIENNEEKNIENKEEKNIIKNNYNELFKIIEILLKKKYTRIFEIIYFLNQYLNILKNENLNEKKIIYKFLLKNLIIEKGKGDDEFFSNFSNFFIENSSSIILNGNFLLKKKR